MEIVKKIEKTGLSWLWVSLIVIFFDQAEKFLVSNYLNFHDNITVLPFLNLTFVVNTGAAFSFLSQMGHTATLLFIVTALIMSIVLSIWLYHLPLQSRWLGISLALILGGAIGNLLDRITHGYVIDFILLHLHSWSFPVFNLADLSITAGAVMLIVDIFQKK